MRCSYFDGFPCLLNGKADAQGRFWIGTIDDQREPRAALYCLDHGELRRMADGITVSNSKKGSLFKLTRKEIYLDGALVAASAGARGGLAGCVAGAAGRGRAWGLPAPSVRLLACSGSPPAA